MMFWHNFSAAVSHCILSFTVVQGCIVLGVSNYNLAAQFRRVFSVRCSTEEGKPAITGSDRGCCHPIKALGSGTIKSFDAGSFLLNGCRIFFKLGYRLPLAVA